MKKYRFLSWIIVCSVVLCAVSGCNTPRRENTIAVGGIVSLTGETPLYGESVSKGIRLATSQINEAGGVLGKTIEYIELDDKGDKKETEKAYHELKKKKVVGILGGITTEMSIALGQAGKKSGIAIISPTALAPEVTTFGTNLFRVSYTAPYQSRTMASFASEELGAKKIGVLYQFADTYASGSVSEFGYKAQQLGVKDIIYRSYSKDDTDFTEQLEQIKQEEPDVLFVPATYKKFAMIAQQARQMGIKSMLLGGVTGEGVLSVADERQKECLEGAYFSASYFAPGEDEKSMAFAKAYERQYGEEPNSFAALGYDAAMLMYTSIQKAGEADPKKVIEQLTASETEGVTGPIHLNSLGDPENKRIFILKISEGQYTVQTLIAPEPV